MLLLSAVTTCARGLLLHSWMWPLSPGLLLLLLLLQLPQRLARVSFGEWGSSAEAGFLLLVMLGLLFLFLLLLLYLMV